MAFVLGFARLIQKDRYSTYFLFEWVAWQKRMATLHQRPVYMGRRSVSVCFCQFMSIMSWFAEASCLDRCPLNKLRRTVAHKSIHKSKTDPFFLILDSIEPFANLLTLRFGRRELWLLQVSLQHRQDHGSFFLRKASSKQFSKPNFYVNQSDPWTNDDAKQVSDLEFRIDGFSILFLPEELYCTMLRNTCIFFPNKPTHFHM